MSKKQFRSRPIALAAAVLLVLVLSLLWWGGEKVPEGQVMAVPGGDGEVATVWEPGWHWRWPLGGDPLPLPSEPLEASTEVELTTREGAAIVLDVTGRFALAEGAAGDWVEAAGWRPFVEGLEKVAADVLAEEVDSADPAAIFGDGATDAASDRLRRALADAGLEVERLFVVATAEKNPVAVAAARSRVAALARPTGRKVLVVGWDGADWLLVQPLLDQGRLPNLARLLEGGVRGELRSETPLLSPLIWTTIATGRTVEEHGVADFLVEDPETGAMVPISSASRQVHALWTLLSAFDMTTDAIAWWATWPAEEIRGTMVTDRVAYQLFEYGDEAADATGKVYPESAWPQVEERLVAAEEIGWEEMSRFVDVSEEELERRWNALPADRRQEDKVNHLRKIIATTRSYHDITLHLLEEQADLTLAYYEGTDTVGHRFARFLPPAMPGVSEEEVARFGGAMPAFYEWADELLGELLAAVDEETLVLLISDHGFFTGEARPESDPSDFAAGASQWHRLYGIIVGDGPGVEAAEVRGATIFDVAPTVLAALGLPVAEDMRGEVLDPLLPPDARQRKPELIGKLASYEVLPRRRPQEVASSAEDAEDRLRELAALGYISQAELEERSGDDGAAPGDGAPRSPGPATPERRAGGTTTEVRDGEGALQGLSTEAYNLGRIAQREGRYEDAERHYRTAVERLPSFGTGWASLAQLASRQGNHGEAFDLLVQGFRQSSSMPLSAITGLVDEAKPAGRLDDAERVLEGMRSGLSDVAAYHAAWGLLHESRGNLGTALASYERALAIDPLDQLSVEQKIGILRGQGREAEAKRFLTNSFEGARGSVSAMNQLAVAALRQRWPVEAERLLRRVLESDPGNPGVLANLAASLAQQRKMEEAAQVMRRAIERDPDNAGNYYNLGAMLAEQGQTREALDAFRQAAARGMRNPAVHVAAAKMAFRLGDRAGAEAELQRALDLQPGHPEASQLLEVLRQAG